jgi:ferredoxin
MFKITIDRDKCISCGCCAAIFPATFKIDDDVDSKAYLLDKPDLSNSELPDAADNCPTDAIKVEMNG